MIDLTAQMSSHLPLNHFLSIKNYCQSLHWVGFKARSLNAGFYEKFISPQDLFLNHGLY